MNKFLTSNSASMRLARTILQAVIGVLITWCGDIIGLWVSSPVVGGFVTALTIAILTPIMKALGNEDDEVLDSTYTEDRRDDEDK